MFRCGKTEEECIGLILVIGFLLHHLIDLIANVHHKIADNLISIEGLTIAWFVTILIPAITVIIYVAREPSSSGNNIQQWMEEGAEVCTEI